MSRRSTARGSVSGSSLGGPIKVKAFLFTEGSLKVENNFSGLRKNGLCHYMSPVPLVFHTEVTVSIGLKNLFKTILK